MSTEDLVSGVADWFFRQLAFPELPDNETEYFLRYYSRHDRRTREVWPVIREKRVGLERLFHGWIEEYQLLGADLVGFTSMFSQNVASLALARLLKEGSREITVVMGGANCEAPMGRVIVDHAPQIDFVFSGPSLVSFPEFVGYRMERDLRRCHGIDGVFSKENRVRPGLVPGPAGVACSADLPAVRAFGQDLDIGEEIPLEFGPFLDGVEKKLPDMLTETTLVFETSRGCWWAERSQCNFCGLNSSAPTYRAMSAEKALRQFAELFRYYPRCKSYEAVDRVMNKAFLEEVFPFLQAPDGAAIFYEVRVDLSEQDMQTLARAGVRVVQPGIEALANRTLRLMRKGSTVFQNIRFLKSCAIYGVAASWNLLVGCPGENEGTYRKYYGDIPSLVHLPPPKGPFAVRFDRYSPFFVHAREHGLDLHPVDFYALTYPLGPEALRDLAYYFMDHNVSAAYLGAMSEWFARISERCELWRDRWRGGEGAAGPVLHFESGGNGGMVVDSRSGEEIRYEVGALGRRILSVLREPRSVDELVAALGSGGDMEVVKEMSLLEERHLLFQDDGCYLSLVLDREPHGRTMGRGESKATLGQPGAPRKDGLPPAPVRQSREARRTSLSSLPRKGTPDDRRGK